jgi:hypothetical protein
MGSRILRPGLQEIEPEKFNLQLPHRFVPFASRFLSSFRPAAGGMVNRVSAPESGAIVPHLFHRGGQSHLIAKK